MKTKLSVLLTLFCCSLLLLVSCAPLPDNSGRKVSHVISGGESTHLGRSFSDLVQAHPDQSGVILLKNGLDAFVGRALLATLAEKSIDVQYYMFHQDTVGRLLIREFIRAADRGVRVRLLIDDMYGDEADDVWSALETHPNMEVRLYNPFARDHSKALQMVTQVKRVNHRMHSKTYTVDNQITIVGGRNIGDEYFNANEEVAFSDLDAMAIGSVVPDVSDEFDEYWNNRHSFPVSTLIAGIEEKAVPEGALDSLRKELDEFYQQPQTLAYREAVNNSTFANGLRDDTLRFTFSEAKIIHDSAEKMTKENANWKEELLIAQLAPYVRQANTEFTLVSPYFVPGQRGADALCNLAEQGVRVRVLTNSLVSNDVAAVHTGYIRHRKELLRCGVALYELNEQLKKLEAERFTWLPGVSKSSLHAKTMAIDRSTMFVGSFNFDPRSLNINTEIGILFRDPALTSESSKNFDDHIDKFAFRVELVKDDKGKETMRWTGIEDGREVVFTREPYASLWQRIFVNVLRILPIDSML